MARFEESSSEEDLDPNETPAEREKSMKIYNYFSKE